MHVMSQTHTHSTLPTEREQERVEYALISKTLSFACAHTFELNTRANVLIELCAIAAVDGGGGDGDAKRTYFYTFESYAWKSA